MNEWVFGGGGEPVGQGIAGGVLLGAVLIDVLLGEVPSAVHPVVGMGWLTRTLLRKSPVRPSAQLLFGGFIVLVVVGASGGAAWGLVQGLEQLRDSAGGGAFVTIFTHAVEALLLSTLFAGRGLIGAGRRMRAALSSSLAEGRMALSHLCSREANDLTAEELCGATVESLAENASDSFIAPLFWYAVVGGFGGPGLVAAACYRATNTLDAMIGYRGRYEYLGKCAARLDDVLNWLPARLTALMLLFGGVGLRGNQLRGNLRRGWRVARREHSLTESPNAGWPMAMAAGILGVALAKRGSYVLGRGLAPPDTATIARSERLIGSAFALFTVTASLVLGAAP